MPRIKIRIALLVVALVLVGATISTSSIFTSKSSSRGTTAGPTPAAQTILPIHLPSISLPPPFAVATATAVPPPSGLVVVTNESGQSMSIVDAATNTVTKTIPLGIPAHGLRLSPDGQTAWVFSDLPSDTDVYLVDPVEGKVVGTKQLRVDPTGVAFTANGTRAMVALSGADSLSFLDMASLNEIGSIALGRLTDGMQIRRQLSDVATLKSTAGETVYVAARGSGVVWALDAASGSLLREIETGGGPIALIPDPTKDRVYAITDTLNQIVSIDAGPNVVADRIALPGRPTGATMASNGQIWVTGGDLGEVWVVDPTSMVVAQRIRVGNRPSGVALSGDGQRAYITNSGDNTLSILDVAPTRILSTIKVGGEPSAVAYTSASRRLSAPMSTAVVSSPVPTPALMPTSTSISTGNTTGQNLAAGTVVEPFVPGADTVTAMVFPPDGRVFYTEMRTGKIRVVENGKLQPEPFYQFTVAGEPETGLLGLVLDPNFAQNHYVYVYYTAVDQPGTATGGPHGANKVVRLTDSQGKGTNLTPILPNLPAGPIHDAGRLRFGPDGKLYVSIGETNQMDLSQDLGSLAGKILRVNSDGSIPSDNPFVGQAGHRGEIWAYGLRNTFGFDFEPNSGGIFAADNGPGDDDELNLIRRGGNYGWPPAGYQDKPGLIDPIAVYNPTIAPAGTAFYRGTAIPEWTNDLFYCNYHRHELRRIHLAPLTYDRIVSDQVVTPNCTYDVESGSDGALYFADGTGISRIRRSDAPGLTPVPAPSIAPTATAVLPPGTSETDRDVDVSLSEFILRPSRAKVPAGSIRFTVENLGTIAHALRVVGQGVDVSTDSVLPKGTTTLDVNLPAGTYTLSCPIENHAMLGMTATLTVVGN